jgi:HK97 family phage major capsid protein
MKHALNSPIPRALLHGAAPVIHAEQKPEQLFRELRAAIDEKFGQHNERVENLEAALNAFGAGNIPIGAPQIGAAADPEYSRTFASYFRKGDGDEFLRKANSQGERATIQASMSVGDNSAGGYLAPVEWDRKISEAQRATSPMRRLATVQATSVGAYMTLWNTDAWGSGWVGETAARPQTSTTSLAPITFRSGEIYANPAVTQQLLDDAALNVEDWLRNSVQKEFNRQESIAFLAGDGVNKPAGFLTYVTGGVNAALHPGGAIEVVDVDIDPAATAATIDALTDFMYALEAPYRQNATWLMSSLTAAVLAKLKDANGQLIWRESLIAGQPSTLLGRPVEIDEGMPAPGVVGNLPIAFGDFKAGYLINDRIGTRVLRDPYTNKPYVMFYVTRRVGGGVLDPNAIRVARVPA